MSASDDLETEFQRETEEAAIRQAAALERIADTLEEIVKRWGALRAEQAGASTQLSPRQKVAP